MNRLFAAIFLILMLGAIVGIAIISTRTELPTKTQDSEQVEDLRRVIAEKDAIIERQKQIIAQQRKP